MVDTAAQKKDIQKGDYISARKVVKNDGSDTRRDEGVVVGLPRPANGGHYDILNPYDPQKPFQGHADDALPIPDEMLTQGEKAFRDSVKRQLQGDG